MARMLRITDITNFVAPRVPQAAVFVHASHDLYVPNTKSVDAMWAHVRQAWGCEVRKIRGGHVSASLFSLDTYVGLIIEVIQRLISAQMSGSNPSRPGRGASAPF